MEAGRAVWRLRKPPGCGMWKGRREVWEGFTVAPQRHPQHPRSHSQVRAGPDLEHCGGRTSEGLRCLPHPCVTCHHFCPGSQSPFIFLCKRSFLKLVLVLHAWPVLSTLHPRLSEPSHKPLGWPLLRMRKLSPRVGLYETTEVTSLEQCLAHEKYLPFIALKH